MLEFSFVEDNPIVEFYPYRRAQVAHSVSIDLENFDINIVLKKYLEDNKKRLDNHICWKTADGMCFQYSDRVLYIGLTIIKGKY